MFEQLEMGPADPILGLTAAFNEDTNPDKINLGVGVYKDSEGKTPIFNSVHKAEERLLQEADIKNYLPIGGGPEYAVAVQQLLYGGRLGHRVHKLVIDHIQPVDARFVVRIEQHFHNADEIFDLRLIAKVGSFSHHVETEALYELTGFCADHAGVDVNALAMPALELGQHATEHIGV